MAITKAPLCRHAEGCGVPASCNINGTCLGNPAKEDTPLILWRLRELESTQCFVLETPALILKDGYEHVPLEEGRESWKYPQLPPEGYVVEWTAVCFGSEENLDCIASALNEKQYRMF